MTPFALLLALVAVLAGGIASVVGFGIGSLLTPMLALEAGTKVAVAAISVPHFVGTAVRFWMLRGHVDRTVLFGFGVASALGGLAGALVHTRVSSRPLAVVFGVLVIVAGGLLVNLAGLRLLNAGRGESLNVCGAWLHVLTDALGSVGAILGGFLIRAFVWGWADPAVSVLIGLLVIFSS